MNSLNLSQLVENQTDLSNEFKNLANRLVECLKKENIHHIRSYDDPQLLYFNKLPVSLQLISIENLKTYTITAEETQNEGYQLKDNNAFIWRFLQKRGYVPPTDLFQNLTEEKLVEIYNQFQIQEFRNLAFYNFCSYTIEDIHSREWFDLFYRDSEINLQFLQLAQKLFNNDFDHTFPTNIGEHFLKEINSQDKIEVAMKVEHMCPLFSKNKAVAAVTISKARRIFN